jgi:hypothetical protein
VDQHRNFPRRDFQTGEWLPLTYKQLMVTMDHWTSIFHLWKVYKRFCCVKFNSQHANNFIGRQTILKSQPVQGSSPFDLDSCLNHSSVCLSEFKQYWNLTYMNMCITINSLNSKGCCLLTKLYSRWQLFVYSQEYKTTCITYISYSNTFTLIWHHHSIFCILLNYNTTK